MKKIYSVLIFVLAAFLLINCENEKIGSVPIQISTDKLNYSINENIVVELINNSDSAAKYNLCNEGIPPNIYRFEKNSWKLYWSPICIGYSYCCSQFMAGSSYKDTLNISEKGTYRIEYQFIIRPSQVFRSYFSSSIKVE
jgi:hypothetical protein